MKDTFQEKLIRFMEEKNMTQTELANKSGIRQSSISAYIRGEYSPKQDKIEAMAKALNIPVGTFFFDNPENKSETKDHATIPVYGIVPAGIAIEAIENISDYEDISFKEYNKDKQYIGLKVSGDSMFPKYLEGDTIIIEVTTEFVSGQDCVVYVNGYDATLKTVIKNLDGTVTLKPINPNYPPKTYGKGDDDIKILGVVKELRRKI